MRLGDEHLYSMSAKLIKTERVNSIFKTKLPIAKVSIRRKFDINFIYTYKYDERRARK